MSKWDVKELENLYEDWAHTESDEDYSLYQSRAMELILEENWAGGYHYFNFPWPENDKEASAIAVVAKMIVEDSLAGAFGIEQ